MLGNTLNGAVRNLTTRGVKFLNVPSSYYADLRLRLFQPLHRADTALPCSAQGLSGLYEEMSGRGESAVRRTDVDAHIPAAQRLLGLV